jgi:multiple sugar transport system permease protein
MTSDSVGSTLPAVKNAGPGRAEPWQALPYVFLTPALIILVFVAAYPILFAVQRSSYETRFMELGSYVGLKNYIDFFTTAHGWTTIGNSLLFTFASVTLTVPFGLVLALVINRPLPFRTAIRTILIMPWIVSQTIAGLLWSWLLNPSFGPVNYILGSQFGLRAAFFQDPGTAMAATVVVNVWQSYGLAFVLLLAALQTIPEELYEAAELDGAGRWAMLRWVTLPSIRSTLAITLIMLTLHNINMVTLILVLTGGGPANATETLSIRVFNEAFQFQNMGQASMVGVIIAVLNVVFSVAYLRIVRRQPEGA